MHKLPFGAGFALDEMELASPPQPESREVDVLLSLEQIMSGLPELALGIADLLELVPGVLLL
jgi:hypothetical protein